MSNDLVHVMYLHPQQNFEDAKKFTDTKPDDIPLTRPAAYFMPTQFWTGMDEPDTIVVKVESMGNTLTPPIEGETNG